MLTALTLGFLLQQAAPDAGEAWVVETLPGDGGLHQCTLRLENGVVAARYGEGCEHTDLIGLRPPALEASWPDGCPAWSPIKGGAHYGARSGCAPLDGGPGASVLLLEPTESERVRVTTAGELVHPGGGRLAITTEQGFEACLSGSRVCFSAKKAVGLIVAWSVTGAFALVTTRDGERQVSALFDVKKKKVRALGPARFVGPVHLLVGDSILDLVTGTKKKTGCAERGRVWRLADGSVLCLNLSSPPWLTRERAGKTSECNGPARWLLEEDHDDGAGLALQPDASCATVVGDLLRPIPGLR